MAVAVWTGDEGVMRVCIQDMPVAFCRERCNAWSEKHGCRSERDQTTCDHPEASEAGKYGK